MRKINAHAMLGPRYWILDWLSAGLNDPWNFERCSSAVHIYVKVNLGEDWIVYFIECRRQQLEDGSARFGIEATNDPKYCFTLLRLGSLIYDRLNFSMTLVNSLRPGTNPRKFQAV